MNLKQETLVKWGIGLIILLGTGLRILMYWQNRSLFIDEACLSSQLIERPFVGLFDNLEYQYAPPLFAVLVKLSTELLGSTEYALRLVPLLASVLSFPLFYKFCRAFLPRSYCIFPLFLFAFGMPILQYATEVKQYSTDILITIALLLLTIKWPASTLSWKRTLFWALIGSLVVWLSMPGVFILFGIGIFYLFEYYKKKEWRASGHIVVPIGSWLLSFGLYYFSIIRNDIGLENLEDYHARFFVPLLPLSYAEWAQLGNIFITFFRTAIGSTTLAIAFGILTFLIGIWQLKKEQPAILLLFLLPLLASTLASGLKLYSLIPRLTLFFMPILLILVGLGTSVLMQRFPRYGRYLIYGILLILMVNQKGYSYFYTKLEIEELRPLLALVRSQYQVEDAAYLYTHATHAYVFYSTHYQGSAKLAIPQITIGKYGDHPATVPLPDAERCWLIFSHIEPEMLEWYKTEFAQRGTIREEYLVKGGGALLLER